MVTKWKIKANNKKCLNTTFTIKNSISLSNSIIIINIQCPLFMINIRQTFNLGHTCQEKRLLLNVRQISIYLFMGTCSK